MPCGFAVFALDFIVFVTSLRSISPRSFRFRCEEVKKIEESHPFLKVLWPLPGLTKMVEILLLRQLHPVRLSFERLKQVLKFQVNRKLFVTRSFLLKVAHALCVDGYENVKNIFTLTVDNNVPPMSLCSFFSLYA